MPHAIPTKPPGAKSNLRECSQRPRFLPVIALGTTLAFCLATAHASASSGHDGDAPANKATSSPTPSADPSTSVTPDVAEVEQWIASTHDNGSLPYLVIDKIHAEAFAFDPLGHLQSRAPVLLGLARGDRSVEGVGDKKMAAITPEERITPAGRFVVSLSHDPHGREILWVDYKNAIALHAVVRGTPQEHRAERLASATAADNRISYGCINVPLAFYDAYVSTAFRRTNGLVYILPETSSVSAFFGFANAQPKPGSAMPIGSGLAR